MFSVEIYLQNYLDFSISFFHEWLYFFPFFEIQIIIDKMICFYCNGRKLKLYLEVYATLEQAKVCQIVSVIYQDYGVSALSFQETKLSTFYFLFLLFFIKKQNQKHNKVSIDHDFHDLLLFSMTLFFCPTRATQALGLF